MGEPVLEVVACPSCGQAAEVVARFVLDSTCGPVPMWQTRCVNRHTFTCPEEP